MAGKVRLEDLLVAKGLFSSREKAHASVLAGEVWSGEKRLEKPGQNVTEDTPIEVRRRGNTFISRAGDKLAHGLDAFGVDPINRVCLDIGASTGGFTDCLLKRGAKHVIAVDVGHGQLDINLRNDPRVTVLEKTNARYLTPAAFDARHAEALSLVVMDVSFISLRLIVEPLSKWVPKSADWVLLFKPQFEVSREWIEKGGVVRDEGAVRDALEKFHSFMEGIGFTRRGTPTISPLGGKKSGNLEYLIHYVRSAP